MRSLKRLSMTEMRAAVQAAQDWWPDAHETVSMPQRKLFTLKPDYASHLICYQCHNLYPYCLCEWSLGLPLSDRGLFNNAYLPMMPEDW